MSAPMPFEYEGLEMRTVVLNGEPWFVAADVAKILGYRMASDMTRRLDDADKGSAKVRTPGGDQDAGIINESGLYDSIFRSNAPAAKPFRRWVTAEVLPTIRKSGSYAVAQPQTPAERMAAAVLEAQSIINQLSGRVAELEPSAKAWDELADATGDYDSRAAAQILARAGVDMGQNRLRAYLRQIEWTDRNNRPYQRHVQAGRVAEKVRRWEDRDTGEIHVDHQLRITAKGVGELLAKLTSGTLQVISGGAS
jgi:anti-repressor protein